jgi:RIO kinase 1
MEATVLEETWFEEFEAEGFITDVIMPLKSGKEASIYLCRATPKTGARLLAVKAFRPRQARGFKNDAVYKQGRVITKHRERRAVQNKTRFGRDLDSSMWSNHEHEMLTLLHEAGADVPQPVATASQAILMEYVGDEDRPAPQLRDVRLSPSEARAAFDRLVWNVEVFLANNVVHADLSAYNVLWWEDGPVVIDLPQAVDARSNRNSHELLARDMENLCRHFARFGVNTDPARLTSSLWNRYLFAEL